MEKIISPVKIESRISLKIESGDTLKVWQKISEKGKTRLQSFEGVVISKKHGNEAGATFTVRRVGSDGIGVEKTFPLFSPMIDKIELMRRSKTRRAKLYYLRHKTAKKIREKLRRMFAVGIATVSEYEEEKKRMEQEKVAKEKDAREKEEQAKREAKKEAEAQSKDADASEGASSEENKEEAESNPQKDEGESK